MNQMVALRGVDTAELPPGTRLLNGQYHIVEPLQKGGFALTYVARDSLERHVVIKECFPSGICERSNGAVRAISGDVEKQFTALKQKFVREARAMAVLKHPYVVAVHQVFEENNTAYMALDYVAGMDLISVLEDEPERLTSAFFEATLKETLKAIRHIHANGILHRDIAPDNIRVDAADRITLIDFGAAGARIPNPATAESLLPAVKDGYSPPEFYDSTETHDFSSDLYSIGATFHHLITGEVPPDGQARRLAISSGAKDPYIRLAPGNWKCGYHLLATIDQALDIVRERRPQSADHWLKSLDDLPKVRPVLATAPAPDPDLDEAVSRLVRDVNKTLKASGLKAVRNMPSKTLAESTPRTPLQKRWVDIFGNPIGDLVVWAKQQEPVIAPVVFENDTAELWADPEPAIEQARVSVAAPKVQQPVPAKKSTILTLLSRCLSRRPETCPT